MGANIQVTGGNPYLPAMIRESHLVVKRTARYYAVGEPGDTVRDLWFVLHGYGQLAGRFAEYCSGLAGPGRMVIAPEALNRFYLVQPAQAPASERPVGATWMTREDRGIEIDDYVRYLDDLRAHVVAELPPSVRVRVLGFSQGVATAVRWVMLGRHAPPSELVMWGGLLPPDAVLSAGALQQTPITLVAGSEDVFLNEQAVHDELARMAAAGLHPRVERFAGGHVLNRSLLRSIAERDPGAAATA